MKKKAKAKPVKKGAKPLDGGGKGPPGG